MVPLPRYSNVGGAPICELLTDAEIEELVQRTRCGGAEIVGLLKTGSAYYAPSAAIWQMADAILNDKRKILPCSAYLEGEYGLSGLYMGTPVILGKNGVERIVELKLTSCEKDMLKQSADKVRASINLLEQLV